VPRYRGAGKGTHAPTPPNGASAGEWSSQLVFDILQRYRVTRTPAVRF